MLDVLAFREKHRILRNVRGEVGHALQVAADEQILERRSDRARIGHHVREQYPKHRFVQRIDRVVTRTHVATERAVRPQKRVDTVAQHRARSACHVLDLGIRLARVDVLHIDEFGYLNLRPEQSNIFFKLMELTRRADQQMEGETRARPENVKDRIIAERGYEVMRPIKEDIVEFDYQPVKCKRAYRVVALRKTLSIERSQIALFETERYFFYITAMMLAASESRRSCGPKAICR